MQRLAGPDIIPTDPADRSPTQQATWLLAQLLGWHRREGKSAWWEFHRLMDLTPEDLVDEDDPIGLLEPVGPVDDERKGKQVWRYRYPAQDYDLGRGQVFDPAKKQAQPDENPFKWAVGDVVAVDPAERTVDLRRVVTEPHPRALVPLGWFKTKAHEEALFDLGSWVADHGIQATGPTRAGRDLLFRLPPRVGLWLDEPLRREGEPALETARRLATSLDHTTLAIQGPPGSGKTYTGRPDGLHSAGGRQARRHHGHEPQGHRQLPEGRPRRGGDRGRLRPAGPEGRRRRGARRPASDPREGRHRRQGAPRRWPGERRRGDDLALGVAEDGRVGRRPLRRRGRADLAGERRRDRPRDREPRPARRPPATGPATPGLAPAGRRSVGAGACPRRFGHDAADAGPVPREHLAPASRRCAPSRPRCSTTTGSSRSPIS